MGTWGEIPTWSLTYPKSYHPKRKIIFQPSIFRAYVKLRGCMHLFKGVFFVQVACSLFGEYLAGNQSIVHVGEIRNAILKSALWRDIFISSRVTSVGPSKPIDCYNSLVWNLRIYSIFSRDPIVFQFFIMLSHVMATKNPGRTIVDADAGSWC